VLRDDHRSDTPCVGANGIVCGRRQTTVGDVLSGVAERFNASREGWWQLSVDEKAQSCAPQHGVIVLAGSKLQDGRDVFGFEVGIVGQDLFPSRASGQEIEHILHTNAKTANARADHRKRLD
jgi:hypothetical protein